MRGCGIGFSSFLTVLLVSSMMYLCIGRIRGRRRRGRSLLLSLLGLELFIVIVLYDPPILFVLTLVAQYFLLVFVQLFCLAPFAQLYFDFIYGALELPNGFWCNLQTE